MTQSDAPKMASWWTPTGWERHVWPPAYVVARQEVEPTASWPDDLRRAGYDNEIGTNLMDDANAAYQVNVWRHHGERHLFVEIWDFEGSPAQMFVAEEHMAPFFFDKLPKLVRFQREINSLDIHKAIIAFVRRGHGLSTISEDGSETFEERQLREAVERRDRAFKRDDAKASGAS